MEGNVKIISDGTSRGTKVLVDGKPMRNVKSITIHPIDHPLNVVRVTIEVGGPELDMLVTRQEP